MDWEAPEQNYTKRAEDGIRGEKNVRQYYIEVVGSLEGSTAPPLGQRSVQCLEAQASGWHSPSLMPLALMELVDGIRGATGRNTSGAESQPASDPAPADATVGPGPMGSDGVACRQFRYPGSFRQASHYMTLPFCSSAGTLFGVIFALSLRVGVLASLLHRRVSQTPHWRDGCWCPQLF